MTKTAPVRYMPQLDGLRALAVAAVAWWHWAPAEDQFQIPWGDLGVQLFFVLSGFLITGILWHVRSEYARLGQSGFLSLRRFYMRRFLRIFPLYYAVVLLTALIGIKSVRETFFWNIAYLSNFYLFLRDEWRGPISHFWSLAVEEQFYLFWPWVVLFLPRRWLRPMIISLIILAPLFRLTVLFFYPITHMVYILPISCLDALCAGALLGLTNATNTTRAHWVNLCLWVGLPIWIAIQVLISLGTFQELQIHSLAIFHIADNIQHVALILIFVWIIANASKGIPGIVGRFLMHRVLIFLGTISYGIYVLHMFAPIFVMKLVEIFKLPAILDENLALRLVLMTLLTVGGATFSWLFFERKVNDLKRYFPYVQDIHK